ncbi:hypothetical protein [Vibrio europaeus]|uniref:hypothetical protein n=1 Tax=Vibrio europaeus TaxID=300876 RepID=UPI00233E64F7|nr:hypothetical protein [Vibrio europaeus]MDC5753597.1 hypothetical protein [Vibrio europaeus]MDC5816490.1 hypothetical protein [Vibrio europaeus]
MRKGEFKLRQKEAGNPHLTPAQLRDARKLLEGGTSKRLINILYGTSYKQLKSLRDG